MPTALHISPPTVHRSGRAASADGAHARYQETRTKALELFARCGFSRVSMRDLADFLGIRAGSIYHHIESKEALLFELIEELYENLLQGALLLARRESSPAARLPRLVEAHLQLHESMGAYFRLAEYDLHCLGSEHQARIQSLRQRYETVLEVTLEQLTGEPACAVRRAAVAGIVSQLNQLPASVGDTPTDARVRLELLREMVMGSLRGVLLATRRVADPATQAAGK
ncbi:TetR/AcrR family transcriptional regulator [Pseudomonas boanensis]|uniref:TetR/AcrR family transcriptional regulator n=1 Tax=Metapseudomonas boanensis TaxID=2822138 RepID=UPI0035D4AD57